MGKIRSKIINNPIGIVKFIESLNEREEKRAPISDSLKSNLLSHFSNTSLNLEQIIKKNI